MIFQRLKRKANEMFDPFNIELRERTAKENVKTLLQENKLLKVLYTDYSTYSGLGNVIRPSDFSFRFSKISCFLNHLNEALKENNDAKVLLKLYDKRIAFTKKVKETIESKLEAVCEYVSDKSVEEINPKFVSEKCNEIKDLQADLNMITEDLIAMERDLATKLKLVIDDVVSSYTKGS